MQDSQRLVKEFCRAAGSHISPVPGVPPLDVQALKISMLYEELEELAHAFLDGDLVAVADALGDLQYVLEGTALACGLDLEPILREIHRSNMTKVGPDGQCRRRADGKILKPEGYEPPKLAELLGHCGVEGK